ncbi:MAG: flippase [bacterium]
MADQKASQRVIKNIFFSLYNKCFGFILVFFTSVYVARTLGPEKLGIYSYVLWFVSIITTILGMGLMTALAKYISEFEGEKRRDLIEGIIAYVLRVEIVLSCIVSIPLFVFRNFIADLSFTPKEGIYFGIVFLGILPGMVSSVLCASVQGLQQFKYFTYFSLIISPLGVAAKILSLYLGFGIFGLLVIQFGFSLINVLFYLVVLQKRGIRVRIHGAAIDKKIKKRITKFNLTTFGIVLFDFIIWDKSETFFLGRFCRSDQIAFYSLPFNIVKRFMYILPQIFWEVLLPAMSDFHGKRDNYRLKRTYYLACRYIAFASWPVGVAGIVLAFPFLKYVYGTEFVGAENVLQILFLAAIIVSLDSPSGALLFAAERQAIIIKISTLLAIMNIIMDLILIPKFGAIGAAICNATVQILGSIIGLIYVYRVFGIVYPIKSVSKIVFSSVFMGVVMFVVFKAEPTLLGFFVSIITGIFIYLVSCVVMGSFEEEDLEILNRGLDVLPASAAGFLRLPIDYLAKQKDIKKNGI